MKQKVLFIVIGLAASLFVRAQKWEELSDEQKLAKAQAFQKETQKFMKDSLKLTQTQIDDVSNINLCYLATLDRVMRYGKDDAKKEEVAEAVSQARAAQLDIIMGKDKHERYTAYLKRKIEAYQKKHG